MTKDEHRAFITAVREALDPFKQALKAEIQAELLGPMEKRLCGEIEQVEGRLRAEIGQTEEHLRTEIGQTEERLRGEIGQTEERLRGEIGQAEAGLQDQIVGLVERLDRLEIEVRSLTNDVVKPFIEEVGKQHRALAERLDRLEVQVERNRDKIDRTLTSVTMQERRLMDVYDDVTVIRQRLTGLERRLGGETVYEIAEAELAVAEERSVYEMIRALEERVARLEGRSE